jgi:hypothetical protein
MWDTGGVVGMYLKEETQLLASMMMMMMMLMLMLMLMLDAVAAADDAVGIDERERPPEMGTCRHRLSLWRRRHNE